MSTAHPSQRIDKWLWVARFFKTRSLAASAITTGKVLVDGQRVKPSRSIRPGDNLSISRGETRWNIQVKALSNQRRPASQASALFEETEASITERAHQAELQRAQALGRPRYIGRPDKHDRKELLRLKYAQSDPELSDQ